MSAKATEPESVVWTVRRGRHHSWDVYKDDYPEQLGFWSPELAESYIEAEKREAILKRTMAKGRSQDGFSKEPIFEVLDRHKDDPHLRTVIDHAVVVVSLHPGWDDAGEELGDPTYLGKWWIADVFQGALKRLGYESEQA